MKLSLCFSYTFFSPLQSWVNNFFPFTFSLENFMLMCQYFLSEIKFVSVLVWAWEFILPIPKMKRETTIEKQLYSQTNVESHGLCPMGLFLAQKYYDDRRSSCLSNLKLMMNHRQALARGSRHYQQASSTLRSEIWICCHNTNKCVEVKGDNFKHECKCVDYFWLSFIFVVFDDMFLFIPYVLNCHLLWNHIHT